MNAELEASSRAGIFGLPGMPSSWIVPKPMPFSNTTDCLDWMTISCARAEPTARICSSDENQFPMSIPSSFQMPIRVRYFSR